MITCPKCSQKLVKENNSYICVNHHCYDIARQGYVNLLLGKQASSGDNPAMVEARSRFLRKDYYVKLKNRLVEFCDESHSLVDLACGEGYYTKAMAEKVENSVGIDMSKAALKHAARLDKNTKYILASIFHCPIENECADCITNIFAPAPVDEVVRILKPIGRYIRVIPAKDHLWELKQLCYENVYENEEKLLEDERLTLVAQERVEDVIELENNADLMALFEMTPYAYKTSKEAVEKLKRLSSFKTRISFMIQIYHKK